MRKNNVYLIYTVVVSLCVWTRVDGEVGMWPLIENWDGKEHDYEQCGDEKIATTVCNVCFVILQVEFFTHTRCPILKQPLSSFSITKFKFTQHLVDVSNHHQHSSRILPLLPPFINTTSIKIFSAFTGFQQYNNPNQLLPY